MTLVVEDGTGGDPAANTYCDIATVKLFTVARGTTLTESDAEIEALIIKAMDYLEALRAEYQGSKTAAANPLQWPRDDVFIDCVAIDDDVIPEELKSALGQLVIEQHEGIELTPTVEEGLITKEVVGPLATTFSSQVRTDGQPRLTAVDRFLAPLLDACGQGRPLEAIRI